MKAEGGVGQEFEVSAGDMEVAGENLFRLIAQDGRLAGLPGGFLGVCPSPVKGV